MRKLLLLVAVLLLPSPAAAEWWEAKTDRFIVYSGGTASDAEKFAARLERLDMALRSLQNIKFDPATSDSRRLTIFRSGTVDDIGRLAGSYGVAGFYIPRLGGSVAFTPARSGSGRGPTTYRQDSRTQLDPQSVLFHEYAHHFMFQHFSAAYPSWYVEGFAETAATIDLKDDGSFHLGNPPQYRSEALFSMMNVPVKRLLTGTNKPTMEDVYGHYTIGWLLNHYLTFEPSRKGQLKQYLRLINGGTEPADAAKQAFGDLDKLDREIHRYKSGKLPGVIVKPADYSPPEVAMRKLGADEEAIIRVKMRSKRGVSRKTASDVARDARSIAQKFPESFRVNLALAEAEFDAEQLNAAEAAADKALALKPDSVEAMLYKGMVYLERGKKDKAQLANARTWFVKAFEADPEHPAPLYNNYLTYYHSGAAIPKNALFALDRAYEFAPFDGELRLVLARQLLSEKKGALARSVLLPFALSPHQSKSAQAMYDVVELIEGNKVDEAYSKLTAEMNKAEQKKKDGEED